MIKQFFAKHKKAVLIGGAVIAAALIAWYFYKKGRFSDNFHGQGKAELLGLSDPGRFGGNVGFTTDWKHGLKSGDRVEIKQATGAKYPQYDGATTVASILDEYNFTINKGFAGSSPANAGYFKVVK